MIDPNFNDNSIKHLQVLYSTQVVNQTVKHIIPGTIQGRLTCWSTPKWIPWMWAL